MDRLQEALPYFMVSWLAFTLYFLVKFGKVADAVAEYFRTKTSIMRRKDRREQYERERGE